MMTEMNEERIVEEKDKQSPWDLVVMIIILALIVAAVLLIPRKVSGQTLSGFNPAAHRVSAADRQPKVGEDVVVIDRELCDPAWSTEKPNVKVAGCIQPGNYVLRNTETGYVTAVYISGNEPSQHHRVTGKVLSPPSKAAVPASTPTVNNATTTTVPAPVQVNQETSRSVAVLCDDDAKFADPTRRWGTNPNFPSVKRDITMDGTNCSGTVVTLTEQKMTDDARKLEEKRLKLEAEVEKKRIEAQIKANDRAYKLEKRRIDATADPCDRFFSPVYCNYGGYYAGSMPIISGGGYGGGNYIADSTVSVRNNQRGGYGGRNSGYDTRVPVGNAVPRGTAPVNVVGIVPNTVGNPTQGPQGGNLTWNGSTWVTNPSPSREGQNGVGGFIVNTGPRWPNNQ